MLFPRETNYAGAVLPPPRQFQQTAHDALREGFRAGHRCQMLMSPTGSGKTYIGMRLAREALVKGKRVVFVCDRTTLINQTSAVADSYGLTDHAIIQANHHRRDPSLPFQIASAQTIAKRDYWPDADLIIIDEAHTQLKVWTEYIPIFRGAVIGLSATPITPGLDGLFTNLVNATTMHELTQSGVLAPLSMLTCTPTDMKGAKTVGGEWTDKAAAERGMEIVGDVVSEWQRHGKGRKTIVFGSTIAHCEELARQFVQAGVMAATFTCGTTSAERDALLAEYRKPDGALRVLISVEALAKGFDVPDVGCVVDCRPLRKSLSAFIQMIGRGLRSSPGKTDCILLDHSGNIQRFKQDFEDLYFNGLDKLDSGAKLDKVVRQDEDFTPEKASCPSCGFQPFYKRCMACGFERTKTSTVEALPGVMQEIIIGGKRYADNANNLWAQCCSYARAHSAPEKQKWRAKFLYKDITGSEPMAAWKFESTPDALITTATLNKIRQKNIAYKKARAKTLEAA